MSHTILLCTCGNYLQYFNDNTASAIHIDEEVILQRTYTCSCGSKKTVAVSIPFHCTSITLREQLTRNKETPTKTVGLFQK